MFDGCGWAFISSGKAPPWAIEHRFIFMGAHCALSGVYFSWEMFVGSDWGVWFFGEARRMAVVVLHGVVLGSAPDGVLAWGNVWVDIARAVPQTINIGKDRHLLQARAGDRNVMNTRRGIFSQREASKTIGERLLSEGWHHGWSAVECYLLGDFIGCTVVWYYPWE
jgi:hypothetical protein